jgi:cytochrome P450
MRTCHSSPLPQDVSYNLLDAGQETTSKVLAACLVALASDPRVLAKLREEQQVREVIESRS